jgi:hypothetical protein
MLGTSDDVALHLLFLMFIPLGYFLSLFLCNFSNTEMKVLQT